MTGPQAQLPAELDLPGRLAAQLSTRQAGWLAVALAALAPALARPVLGLALGLPLAALAVAFGWLRPAGRPLAGWLRPLAGYLARSRR